MKNLKFAKFKANFFFDQNDISFFPVITGKTKDSMFWMYRDFVKKFFKEKGVEISERLARGEARRLIDVVENTLINYCDEETLCGNDFGLGLEFRKSNIDEIIEWTEVNYFEYAMLRRRTRELLRVNQTGLAA